MTSFIDTWNAAYEGIPSDNEATDEGAMRIRNLKVDIRQRLAVDHSWAGDANDGKHNQVTLRITVDPTLDPTDGALYIKSVAGNGELFYKDSSGNVLQLTAAGALDYSPFPSGTQMMFVQAVPPAGWTQVTGFNDRMIRVVNDGSGGVSGGSWTISGTNVTTTTSTTTTTTINSVNMNVTINPVTLVTANLPSHTHGFSISASATAFGSGSNAGYTTTGTISGTTDGGTGSGASFTPTGSASFTGGSASSSSSSSSASSFSNDGTWRPSYVNTLVARKN